MILLVLGMHRSGTSAVTRTLSLMGAAVPGTLMEPVAGDNEMGFWESREIMEIHDRFLASAGSHWQDMRPLPGHVFHGPAAIACADEIALLLRKGLAESPLLVVKDPRLCRLMPLWRRLLHGLGEPFRVVLTVRNPLEVAQSLRARNGIEREQALVMWLVHSLAAERDSRGLTRRIARYGDFLSDPRREALGLAAAFGIFDRARVDAALPEIESFWRETMRHHRQSDEAFLADPDVPGWVRRAYDLLLRDPPPPEELDGLAGEVACAMQSLRRYLDPEILSLPARLAEQLERKKAEAEMLEDRLSRTLAVSAEREVSLNQRAELAARSEAEVGVLRERLHQALEVAASQSLAAAGKDALLERHGEWLREKDARIAEVTVALRELGQAVAERNEAIAAKDAEMARLAAEREELRRLSARQGESVAALEKEAERLSQRSLDQERELAARDGELARQADELRAAVRDLAERDERLARASEDALRQAARIGEKEAALTLARAEKARQEESLAALAAEARAASAEAAARESGLARELESLRRNLSEARAERDLLRDERRRDAERLEALSAAIRDLEASLDRQRTHLAVLVAASGRRHG